VPDELASRFRPAYEWSAAAFNEGELERALSALPDDLEWHAVSEDFQWSVQRGPDEIRRWFADLHDSFEDWRVELVEFEQPSDRAVLVEHVIRGTSRGAGVPAEVRTFELWEFGPLDDSTQLAWQQVGMRPVRVRQYLSREEALAAAAG
jgi:hypothetical protein